MRSRSTKRWIVIGLTLGFLSVSMGAFSAWALTRSPKAVPDCGSPTVDTIPCVQSGHHDGAIALNGQTRIGALKVRPGNWFFIAKVNIASSLSSPHSVPCTLTAGTGTDVGEAVIPPDQTSTATMTVVQSFASSGIALVTCDGITGETASMLKITGIRAGTLFDQMIS